MKHIALQRLFLAACAISAVGTTLVGCWKKENPVVGYLLGDVRIERQVRDRDYFVGEAKRLGADVKVRSADGDDQRQIQQLEAMIDRKIPVVVIMPIDAKSLGPAIKKAKDAGMTIIAYDRLILDADIDAYVSFDNVRVGEMLAEGVIKAVPKGRYFLLGGAPTDNNAKLLREGQLKVLKPYIDKGEITVVGDSWVTDWSPSEAFSIVSKALAQNQNKIDGIVASSDNTAGGAIQALAAQQLAGKVAISGQDAELDACKRVLDGTQSMTVYKPLKLLASKAASLAVDYAKGNKPAFSSKIDNGKKQVDSLLLPATVVTRANMNVLVTDGFHTKEQLGLQ